MICIVCQWIHEHLGLMMSKWAKDDHFSNEWQANEHQPEMKMLNDQLQKLIRTNQNEILSVCPRERSD